MCCGKVSPRKATTDADSGINAQTLTQMEVAALDPKQQWMIIWCIAPTYSAGRERTLDSISKFDTRDDIDVESERKTEEKKKNRSTTPISTLDVQS